MIRPTGNTVALASSALSIIAGGVVMATVSCTGPTPPSPIPATVIVVVSPVDDDLKTAIDHNSDMIATLSTEEAIHGTETSQRATGTWAAAQQTANAYSGSLNP